MIACRFFLTLMLLAPILQAGAQQLAPNMFYPAKEWKDTNGKPIKAHGGGMLYNNGTYYWYGENPDTIVVGKMVGTKGISCYSSKDLYHWKNEGIVLKSVTGDPNHDLYFGNIMERPKVIYNEITKQYVMWLHVDQAGNKYARQGVAVSKLPVGPFEFLHSSRPNNHESGDLTLFKDDDGKAYVIYTSEGNKALHICLLSDDYLEHSGVYKRLLVDLEVGAPAIFKSRNKYFMIASGSTLRKPNETMYAAADTLLGTWALMGTPCKGAGADTTFGAQVTCVFPLRWRNESFVFMADRWAANKTTPSAYVWLPVQFNGNKLHIKWLDEWNLDFFKRRTW